MWGESMGRMAKASGALLSIMLVVSAPCAVKVSKTGAHQWTLESSAVRVTFDGQRACFEVVDKRCGQRWEARGVRGSVPSTEWTVGPAAAELSLDGVIGEKEWTGARIDLTGAGNLTWGKDRPAASDFSGQVFAGYRSEGLLLAVRVRDDQVNFPQTSEQEWWEWDSVEFWLGSQQYAAIPAPPGGVVVAMGHGQVEGAKVASRLVEGGYEVEVLLPWPGGKPPGANPVPFALGLNDADEPGRRESQLYFPASWQHSVPESFARTKFAAEAAAPAVSAEQETLVRDITELPTRDGLSMIVPALALGGAGKLWDAKVTLRIEGESELVVTVDREPRDAPTQHFSVLSPLGQAQPAEIYEAAYCNGIAVPDDDRAFLGAWWWVSGGADMPWVGYGTPTGPAYVVLAETPDGAFFRVEALSEDQRLVPRVYFAPLKGKFARPRVFRYAFFERGGFVAICKWYREWARKTGLLVTAAQKMRRRPQLERIKGAPDFWGIDPSICEDLRRHGVRHAIVNDGWPAEAMEKVKALGYLVSRYDNYEDMLEGPREEYGKGKMPDDVVLNADGSRMTAWRSWDGKIQWMKRCSVLYEETARLQIPRDLAEHPYNARFIDVTTACGLRECYDPAHPCDYTEDREARQRLARYVSEELGLVLGGEHGQWWGVPYYDYWEGMQSGGFYSWPAGYVGESLPEKREDIGERYWRYGVGHQRRVPLWQLVFGDCVLSTWYWGDSTGHLYKVAPDLDDRKDCFNLLYGTVPLFWTNQPFSFRWSDPDLRLRLLQSYYVTCPVQEQTGWSEMMDYRFVTADRTVHESRFANGIKVLVNFGEQAYLAQAGRRRYELPQYGFLVTGPNVLAYRAVAEGRTVTFVKTPTAVYADAAGKTYDFGPVKTDGRVAVEVVAAGEVRVIPLTGTTLQLRPADMPGGQASGGVRVYAEDEEMAPAELVEGNFSVKGVTWPKELKFGRVLWGPRLGRPDLAIGRVEIKPAKVLQGGKVAVKIELRNHGNVSTGRAVVALYLGQQEKQAELGRKRTDIGPGGVAFLSFDVATTDFDGRHRLVAVADPENSLSEINERNNRGWAGVEVVANPQRWPYKTRLEVAAPAYSHLGYGAETEFDLGICGAPAEVALDPQAVRVVRVEGGQPTSQVLAQFEPADGFDGRANRRGVLVFVDDFLAGRTHEYLVLVGTSKQRTRTATGVWYDAKSRTVRTGAYELSFEARGRPVQWRNLLAKAGKKTMAAHLCASDGAFGWSAENGPTGEVRVAHTGPARIVIEVTRTLDGGFEYRKVFRFYPAYFVVDGEFNKAPAVWSRAGVPGVCQYADSAGNRAVIDGKGDAEDVMGRAPDIKWYACFNEEWASSALSLGAPCNICFWDAGLADVGFTSGETKGLRAVYVAHEGQTSPEFAEKDYMAHAEPLKIGVGEAR